MAELVSIPIAGGIDRSVAKVVGQPRIDRLERARFVQQGQVVRSPGYADDPRFPFPATNNRYRAIGYHEKFGGWAALFGINSSHEFWGYLYRQNVSSWVPPGDFVDSAQYKISPAEAPRRLLLGVTSQPDTQIITTSDPGLVLVALNDFSIGRVRNGRLIYSTPGPFDSAVTTKTFAAGRCLIVSVSDDDLTYVTTYNVAADTFANTISIGDSGMSCVLAASPTFGVPGLGGWMAALWSDDSIIIVKWSGSAFSVQGTIPNTDLPPTYLTGLITGCISGDSFVRAVHALPVADNSLVFGAYNLNTMSFGFNHNPTMPSNIDNVSITVYSPTHVQMCPDPSGSGGIWFVNCASQNAAHTTNDVAVIGSFLLDSGNNLSGWSWYAALTSRMPAGRLIPNVDSAYGVIVPLENYLNTAVGTTSLNVGLEFWQIANNAVSLVTYCAFGEIGISGNQYPRASSVSVRANDDDTGQPTKEILFPFVSNNGARRSEIVRLRLGRTSDPNTLPESGSSSITTAPVNALQQAGDVLGGGLPFRLGEAIDPAGFWFDPRPPYLVTATTGGVSTVGTYLYCIVLTYRDSQGNIIRSAPSVPTKLVIANTTTRIVQVVYGDSLLRATGIFSNNYGFEYYQTVADGNVFYLQGVFATQDPNVNTTGRILYTQGSSGALSGQKPNYAIPPCRCIWRGRDRYIAGGLEQPNRVRFSKLTLAGEGVNFPHPAELGWVAEISEDVTAVAQLDDAWIVASANSIYAIYGQGPDDTGANGSFDNPRKISHNIGIHSWRSLCELPEGMLFQAQDGQIYLILRGTLQIVWFSEHIRDELTDLDTGIARSWMTGVVQHETRNTIHFVRVSGPVIIYDKRVQSWSFDHDDGLSPGLNGALSACAIRMPPKASHYSGHETETYPSVAMLSDVAAGQQFIVYEACADGNVFGSPFGISAGLPDHGWKALLETNDIALWGMSGWGAVNKFSLLLTGDGTSLNGLVTFSFWHQRGGPAVEKRDVAYVLPDADAYATSQFEPVTRKCASFRVRLEWGAENIAGLSLETDMKPLSERTSTGVRT